jgi:hypothetical protein
LMMFECGIITFIYLQDGRRELECTCTYMTLAG